MTFTSLDLTDLPPAATMIIGLVVLMLGVMAYENWRLIRMRRRSGNHDAGLGEFPRYRPWQEISPRMRALRVTMFACWAVVFISMSAVGSIETAALSQPKIADAEFVHAHEIKGGIRFFTDRQERIHAAAKRLIFAFGAVGLALGVILNRIEENWRKRKQQDLLDRLTGNV
jgi:hypothetical protein